MKTKTTKQEIEAKYKIKILSQGQIDEDNFIVYTTKGTDTETIKHIYDKERAKLEDFFPI
jgi:hypothetical protein